MALKKGWDGGFNELNLLINIGLECKKAVCTKLYYVGKEIGVKGVANDGEKQFFDQSENLIHSSLKVFDWQNAEKQIELFKKQLIELAKKIFNDVIRSYEHDPKLVKTIIKARSSLNKTLLLI